LPSGHFKTWNATGISVSRNFGIKFRISRSETIKFVWLPDSLHKKSFGWMKYLKDEPVDLVEEIPFDAYLLDLKLPLWNATFKNDVDVKLKGIIEQHENKNVVYEWEDTKTVPNNLAMEVYEKKIDLNKVRQVGSPLYKMKIIMEDTKGKYLDGWSIDFVMPHPYIDLIIPEQFSKNEKIQINGSSFGNEQKSNTTSANILINNVNADVIEWSNTRIIATAPDVASEGEVFVEIDVAPKGINAYKLQSNILNYSTNDEEIKVVDVQPQLVLSIRRKLTSKDKDYTSKIPSHYELYEFAEENNIKISGSVISIAYSNVVKKNVVVSMDTEVALPIQSKVEGKDDIKCYELPGGKMAKIVHKGAPWEAAPTLQKLSDWISKNNKKTTGPTRMVFLHNLFEETQPEKMLLEIYTPIE
jgi:effector-binding domain-containing protein